MARNEVVVWIRTGDDEFAVILRDLLKRLARLWCCRCGDCHEVEVQIHMRYRQRRTRKSSSEISRLYLWSDRLVAKGIIVVTYVIYGLITCTAKPCASTSVTVRKHVRFQSNKEVH